MIEGIPYLGSDCAETMDLYLPAGESGHRRPAVVVIHGGGFCGGGKSNARERSICADLTGEGYVCASIDYALSTREDRWSAFPQCLQDAKSAVAFLRQHADEHGVDPARIGAIGGSAGGTISLWLALTGERDDLRPASISADTSVAVQVAVNLYGPTDFSLPLPFTTPSSLLDRVSPVLLARAGAPPILTVHGTADKLVSVDHPRVLADALNRVNVPNQVKLVDGGVHGMDLQPPQEDLRPLVFRFLAEALG
jgi:acetyl esterase/lipase